jgi:hypothetical protein
MKLFQYATHPLVLEIEGKDLRTVILDVFP